MKRIIILGSTGSIGTRTLDVVRDHPDRFKIIGLSAHENVELLAEQVREFGPEACAIVKEASQSELALLSEDGQTTVFSGSEALDNLIEHIDADMIVVATVGFCGLQPTFRAIEKGIDIALANKEVLVVAGEIVMNAAREKNVTIIPIDSEHSAVFQCLAGHNISDVQRIILTASGGPFRTKTTEEIAAATIEDVLNHPTWSMGRKITVDSATLMNKGFEVIECCHLFGVDVDRIGVVIHPQSIVHSMVEYIDGSIIAQMSVTDMYLPIQIALSYPERIEGTLQRLDFSKMAALTFELPDYEKFPCVGFACNALCTGGTLPAVLNAANEVAVTRFLAGEIGFGSIPALIENVMTHHAVRRAPSLEDIFDTDQWARSEAKQWKK